MFKILHYIWQTNLGTLAIRTFVIDKIALEARRAQASLCMLFTIVYGLCLFALNVITRPNHSVQTGNYCSNNHFIVPMHIILHLFILHTVHVLNLLPESVVDLPLQHFRDIYTGHSSCAFVLFVVLCLSPFNPLGHKISC